MISVENKNLISIIIPVYNAEKYLPQCLESVCNQTYKNLEIILINDGSTDGSGSICNAWSMKDPRIIVIHKKNGGVSAARNDGLSAATGDFIGFVDSDDWIESRMYEKLIEGIADVDMTCCGYVNYPMDTLSFPVSKGIKQYDSCAPVQAAKYIYERDGYFTAVWNKLYRKSILTKDGLLIKMDTNLYWGEDEVWLAQVLTNCGKISFVPEPLYYWRPTEVSATRTDRVTDRQMTLFTSKRKAMEILSQDEDLQTLMKARMFNDCYSLKVSAYVSRDREKYRLISSTLQQVKKSWMLSKDSSLIRKVKVLILELEMKLRLPAIVVQMTNNVRRHGVKW